MMLSRWSLRAGLGLLLVLSACGERVTATSDLPIPVTGGIGIVSRVTDRIEHGDSPNHLETVAESQEFVAGDVLRVADGGEGLLDFGDYLQLRLFNDTEMRVIKAEHGTDIPLLARIRLEHGGFTGNLAEEGSEAVFETPNGAEITILGTQFFLVYDSENQVLGVGNFAGTVSLSVSGQVVPISSGYYVAVRQDQPPDPERPIFISMTDFEQSSRTLVSPVVAFQALIESPISSSSADTPTPTKTPSPTRLASQVHTSTPACPPILQVVQDANCREGPGTGWEAITGFKSGEELEPAGVSSFQPLWWYVTIPSSRSSCWISDVTVKVIGEESCLPVIAPPPTYTPTPTPQLPTPTPDLPPPAPALISPTGFTIVGTDFGTFEIILQWEAVQDDSGIQGYEWIVEMGQEQGGPYSFYTSGSTSDTSSSFTSQCYQWYHWAVRAVDNAGNIGPYSGSGEFYVHCRRS